MAGAGTLGAAILGEVRCPGGPGGWRRFRVVYNEDMQSEARAAAPAPPTQDRRSRAEVFIDRQLRRTRRQVKLVDLCTALAALAAGVLAALLALVLVDHWLFGLGAWGRLLAFLGLIVGAGWYALRSIVPLVWRSMNPVYAARAIEQSGPSLKNSLINFLLLRARREGIHEAVYAALRERAAADLGRVPIDTAVDRSRLIRVGYVLAGTLAIGAAYVVFSPKDPFRTVWRVAVPWADIARPSRVEIADVLPGDAEVFQGQEVKVTARVRGVREGDAVTLLFSTADRQAVDLPLPLQRAAGGPEYAGILFPGGKGIQQDVVYRIAAGDAVSRSYRLRVSPAPAILIDRLEYDFPAYTQRPRQVVEDDGNIRALEGTQVTICARTNYPPRSAWVELGPLTAAAQDAASSAAAKERLEMEITDRSARRSLLLELNQDRLTPRFAAYQLTFVTGRGQPSENHVVYPIEVIPDLGPEVEILAPAKERLELPQNGELHIEIRALDPDFGLSRVRLRAVVGGADLLDESLWQQADGRGQVVVSYLLRPSQLGLVPGDEVVYWAAAEDNRTAPGGQAPEPNSQRTRNYQLTITAPHSARESGERRAPESPSPRETPQQPAGAEGAPKDGAGKAGSPQTAGQGGQAAREESGGSADAPQGPKPEQGNAPASKQSAPETGKPGEAMPHNQGAQGSAPGPGAKQQTPSSPQGDHAAGQAAPETARDLSREPLHDGEVFEKTLELIQQQQRSTPPDGGDASGPDAGPEPKEAASEGAAGRPENDLSPGRENDGARPAPSPPTSATATDPGKVVDSAKQAPGSSEGQEALPPDAGDQSKGPRGSVSHPDAREVGRSDPGSGQDPSHQKPPGQTSAPGERSKEAEAGSTKPAAVPAPEEAPPKRPLDAPAEVAGERRADGKQGSGQPGGSQEGENPGAKNSSEVGDSPEAGRGANSTATGPPQAAGGRAEATKADRGKGAAPDPAATGQAGSGSQTEPPGGAGSPDGTKTRPASETPPLSEQGKASAGEGGGAPASGPGAQQEGPAPQIPNSDAANLDYARRVTDLVLEYLRSQSDKPDRRLLDELGWSRDDLVRFLDRWQRLKQAAREAQSGQQQLEEALRSLGLAPSRDRVRRGGGRSDDQRGLREAGTRSSPPPEYQDQFHAFQRGTARQER